MSLTHTRSVSVFLFRELRICNYYTQHSVLQ